MRTAVLVLTLTLLASARARAEVVMHRRVVLVAMPDIVFGATAAALGPWSIAVEATAGPPPVDDAAAAAIAHDHDASAVAWLDGDALVIYDDLRGTSERRPAPAPTDDVTAAAIALSIKTALRRPVEIVSLPAVVEVPPPPPWIEAPVVIPPPPETHRRVHVAAHLGLGVPVTSPVEPMVHADARVSVELARIASAVVALGGGVLSSLDTPSLTGRYRELVLGAGAAWPRPAPFDLTVTPSALATLHLTALTGTTEADRPVSSQATTGGVELSLAVDRRVGPLQVGEIMTAEVLLRPTRYQVEGMDVLSVPRFALGFALRVAF